MIYSKKLFIPILILLCIYSCKQDQKLVDGQYITKIERNIISGKNGATLSLSAEQGDKTIYLVRHAEKDTIPSKQNPILTDAGYARSFRLANMLKQTRIDRIYSTLYNRTMHTVDSLATAKGIETKIYQPKEMKEVAETILADTVLQSVIISGHSNTTPAFANVLMGKKVIDMGFDESDYDNILIINILANGERKLYKQRYK